MIDAPPISAKDSLCASISVGWDAVHAAPSKVIWALPRGSADRLACIGVDKPPHVWADGFDGGCAADPLASRLVEACHWS
jgi:hypothetical protein